LFRQQRLEQTLFREFRCFLKNIAVMSTLLP
jgi:hypothetical protein